MGAEEGSDRRQFWIALGALSLLAFTVRLWNVLALHGALGDVQILDAAFYDDEARHLIGLIPDSFDPPPHFANPGYAHFLAAVYRVAGARPMAALFVQAIFGAVETALLGLMAERLSGDVRSGVAASALWAFYAPALYYDGTLLIPSVTAFLVVVALFAWAEVRAATDASRGRLVWAAVAGAAIGGSALVRPTNGFLAVALVAAAVVIERKKPLRPLAMSAFVMLAAAGIVVAPAVSSASRAAGEFVPISTNGGMNLWVGNNPDATGIYYTAPFVVEHHSEGRQHTVTNERDAFLDEARRRTGTSTLSGAGASAFWRREALDAISADPARALGIEISKGRAFLGNDEPGTNASLRLLRSVSPVLRWDLFGFGTLLVLATVGCGLLVGRKRELALEIVGAAVGAPLSACLLFFVSGEYRHPAAPGLVLASGVAVGALVARRDELVSSLRSRAAYLVVPSACLLGIVAFSVESGGVEVDGFKAYAEGASSPRFDGTAPTRSDYRRAEALLDHMGSSFLERVVRAEALLLVQSNRALKTWDLLANWSRRRGGSGRCWQDPTAFFRPTSKRA